MNQRPAPASPRALVLLCLLSALSAAAAHGAAGAAGAAAGGATAFPPDGKAPSQPVLPRVAFSPAEAALRRAAVLAHPERYVTIGAEPAEFRTLKEALAAPDDGRRTFVLTDPVHREEGTRIGRDLTLCGFGAGESVLEAAASAAEAKGRVLEVERGASVLLAGLTVRNGRIMDVPRRAGGIANSGTLSMEDCAVSGNVATYGVGVWTEGRLRMLRCAVTGNVGRPRPQPDQYKGVDDGGAGAGLRIEKGGFALVEDCLIAWNEAPTAGGGVQLCCEASARLVDTTIFGNRAGVCGGGVNQSGGSLTLEACSIAGNRAAAKGQAFFHRGRLKMSGSLIAAEAGLAYFLSTDKGGDVGRGILELNEGNFCESGELPGAATGKLGVLLLADSGGALPVLALPEGSPARGYGARP